VNIFIADDSGATREFVSSVLQLDGHTVVEASDGDQLLAQLGRAGTGLVAPPDLLLVDVLMPNLSGLFVLRAVSQMRAAPPVILMTVLADRSLQTAARRFGAASILYKPFDAAALRGEVTSVVAGRERISQAEEIAPRHPRGDA
jgi:DNA-binding response OmpR family regulator